jgi:hypothetical protein
MKKNQKRKKRPGLKTRTKNIKYKKNIFSAYIYIDHKKTVQIQNRDLHSSRTLPRCFWHAHWKALQVLHRHN